MRLLVLGANGLLGSRVVAEAVARGWQAVGTYHTSPPAFDIELHELDIREVDRFESLLDSVAPVWVVNCAAMTDVDACEQAPELAEAVNARAPATLAASSAERSIGFCQVSTDYVFDGASGRRYDEGDRPDPIQAYGESKLEGERLVLDVIPSALVPRLSFVYGTRGDTGSLEGFPAWVRDQLQGAGDLSLFDDQHVTPTRAYQAADTMLDLLADGAGGVFHVASRSCVTPLAFGREIAVRLGEDSGRLEPGSMADVSRPAARPAHTCLDVGTVEDRLGRPQPSLAEDLDAIDWA